MYRKIWTAGALVVLVAILGLICPYCKDMPKTLSKPLICTSIPARVAIFRHPGSI